MLFRAILVVSVSCAGGGVAAAQSGGGGDVAVSYSFLRVLDDGGVNVPAGWLFSAARDVSPVVAIVGELAGNYKSEDGETLGLHTFQAGVRVAARSSLRVRPFAQVMAGVAVASCCGDSEARFVVEPGGGVDIPMGRRVSLRLGVGIPFTLGDEPTEMVRAHAGIAFDIGRR